eukprot:11420822-Alexandrium_andersonii.AAC.1
MPRPPASSPRTLPPGACKASSRIHPGSFRTRSTRSTMEIQSALRRAPVVPSSTPCGKLGPFL